MRFLLPDTTQRITQTKIPHSRARCSRAKAKRWNQEAMQCPKLVAAKHFQRQGFVALVEM